MNDRIDDFFKDGIDNRSFDFKEEFWDDIAVELDKKDRKKYRPFFWILSGITLPLAFLAMAYYFSNEPDSTLKKTQSHSIAIPENSSSAERTKTEGMTKELSGLTTPEKIEPENRIVSKNIDQPQMETRNRNESVEKIEQKTIQAELAFVEEKAVELIGSEESEKERNIVSTTDINDFEEIVSNEESEVKAEPVKPINEKTDNQTAAVEEEVSQEVRMQIPEIGLISGKESPYLEYSFDEEPTGENPIIPIFKKVKRSWTFGIAGLVGIDNHENKISNWGAGIFTAYRFSKKWSISALATYGEFAGEFAEQDESSTQTNFGFGRETQTQKLSAGKLSILELPVTFNFHRKRHELGLGVQTNYLLKVQGKKEVFEEVEAQTFSRISIESGVLEKPADTKQWNFAGMLNYQYNFPKFSAGISGSYFFENYLPQPETGTKDLLMLKAHLKVNLK